jgi:hypothetical protein
VVEGSGFEKGCAHTSIDETAENKAFRDTPPADDCHSGPPCGPPLDVVEASLAKAITEATAAARFDVVSQLCRELEARRIARSPNVVSLDAKRGSRS